VTNINFRDVIVWINALSEMLGLNPVYRTITGEIIKDSRQQNAHLVDIAEQTSHNGYRLPTGLEWEMAARWRNSGGDGAIFVGGRYWTPGNYASGATGPAWDNVNWQPLDEAATRAVAWYFGASGGNFTRPVGQLLPNHLGIYDMSGNVFEFIYWTDYGRNIRGGNYHSHANHQHFGIRFIEADPAVAYYGYGFRLVRDV